MLHLLQARAQMARGFDDAAEAELLAGIQALERQRMSLRDAALQVSFLDQGLPLFDDMVRFQALQRNDPERALDFVERARGRQLLDAMHAAAGPAELAPARPGNRARPSTSRASGASCPKGSPSSSTSLWRIASWPGC